MVVDESEKQYNDLNKNLEMERMSKVKISINIFLIFYSIYRIKN